MLWYFHNNQTGLYSVIVTISLWAWCAYFRVITVLMFTFQKVTGEGLPKLPSVCPLCLKFRTNDTALAVSGYASQQKHYACNSISPPPPNSPTPPHTQAYSDSDSLWRFQIGWEPIADSHKDTNSEPSIEMYCDGIRGRNPMRCV